MITVELLFSGENSRFLTLSKQIVIYTICKLFEAIKFGVVSNEGYVMPPHFF